MHKMDEPKYYPKVKKAVEDTFKEYFRHVDFEITANKGGSKLIRTKFLKETTLGQSGRLPKPDIMGWVWEKSDGRDRKLVVLEFKYAPTFDSIYQAKMYDELYKADYTALVTAKGYSETGDGAKVLKWVHKNRCLLKTKNGGSFIVIKVLNEGNNGVLTLAQLGNEFRDFPDKPLAEFAACCPTVFT